MTSNFSWTENKIDFDFHSGTDPLKPTMAITNKSTQTSKLELKLHFINATDFFTLTNHTGIQNYSFTTMVGT